MSPLGLGAIGGVVVLLLAVVVMRRRRAAEDEDPLYTVMSADDAGAAVSMDDAYPGDRSRSATARAVVARPVRAGRLRGRVGAGLQAERDRTPASSRSGSVPASQSPSP